MNVSLIRDFRTAVLVVLAVIAALLGGAAPAQAQQTFTVTKEADTAGTCTAGDCSLREAVLAANANAGADVIELPPGDYVLTIDGAGEDLGETGDLDIFDEDVTISGAGADVTTIDASGLDPGDRVLHVHGVQLTLQGVTVTGGDVDGHGGGIFLEGDGGALITEGVDVVDNAASLDGGGVAARGDGIVVDMTTGVVSGNVAGRDGGGLHLGTTNDEVEQHADVALHLDNVVVGSDESAADLAEPPPAGANIAGENAGGVWVAANGVDVSIMSSMIDGNRAAAAVGGLLVVDLDPDEDLLEFSPLVVENSSISQNGADVVGGALVAFVEASYADTSIDGNHASIIVGGLLSQVAPTTLVRSSIDHNSVDDDGLVGGMYSVIQPTSFVESSVSGNSGGEFVGGVLHDDISLIEDPDFAHLVGLSIVDTTIHDNTAELFGGVLNVGSSPEVVPVSAPAATEVPNLAGSRDRLPAASTASHDLILHGELLVEGSTFSGNVASEGEGGGLTTVGSFAEIVNSTFWGNRASEGGGMNVFLADREEVLIRNSTFAENATYIIEGDPDTGGEGDALYVDADEESTGEVQSVNSIFAYSAIDNCFVTELAEGMLVSLGHNIDDDGTCEFSETGDLEVDPLLDDLADNGGPTLTHMLQAGSPAIDAADDDAAPEDDQRDVERPQGAAADVGSVEVGANLVVTKEAAPEPVQRGEALTYTITVTNEGPQVAEGAQLIDLLPEGVTVLAHPEDCELADDTLTCELGDIEPGDSVELEIVVRPNHTGEITNTATAVSLTHEEDAESATASVTSTVVGVSGVVRLGGDDRIETAIEVSKATFGDGSAPAVVLARSDLFPDALAGTPLAIDLRAPLLLTRPESLDARTEAEIQRILPAGSTVVLLGGSVALAPSVEARIQQLGYETTRFWGEDRFETAVDIADRGLGNPDTLFLATGRDFADALAGGTAAGDANAAVLLTVGDDMHPATQAYLATRPGTTRYALGGPASRADGTAIPIVGETRFQTAALIAEEFFDAPTVAGLARSHEFPDALTGGVHVGRQGGPMLLTTTDVLHVTPRSYLEANSDSIDVVYLYGGVFALSSQVEADALAAIQ